MKLAVRHLFSFALLALLFVPGMVFAHQPIVVDSNSIQVVDPEISKAYYGQLAGQSHVYSIESAEPFELYVGVLVPDRPGQKKDVSAVVFETGKEAAPIAVLDAGSFAWQPMYEQFGADNYFAGPEFKKEVPAGSYQIRVFSGSNDSRYSLAVGELESFPPSVIVNSLIVIPQLKRDFFASSPFTLLKSPFGIAYVVLMLVLAFIIGFVYRFIIKKLAKNITRKSAHNIGKNDRLLRVLLGVGLLLGGIYTWSPILLFFAGFCFFEAIFSWCGFYAALGKNTCPV